MTPSKTLGSAVLAIAGLWLLLAVYAVDAALPANVVHLPFEKELNARTWVPQGWGFFTRSPREPDLEPFVLDDETDEWAEVSHAPHSELHNLFGLRRASKAQRVELAIVRSGVPKEAWTDCRDHPFDCLDDAETLGPLTNGAEDPTICGTVGLVSQEPVPWAWARSGRDIVMPSRVARVDVTC
ncbi:MAG TPA: SdpA family antimicrobial peptide system protein [Actinomycetota bacterium]|nr:SdpA family antimicrobial peptide system protein [Actinomycetota bacterium]